MRSIILAVFTLSLAANAAHAVPAQPKTAQGAAKQSKSDRPKLLSTSEDGTKTYRMPSGRKVHVSSGWGETEVEGSKYLVRRENMWSFRDSSSFEVRTVTDKATRIPTIKTLQTIETPKPDHRFERMETMRSQDGTWTDVQRATYSDRNGLHKVVLAPGGSQVEDRPAQIDEAQIAKQYNARQKRRADAAKAFGGKVE